MSKSSQILISILIGIIGAFSLQLYVNKQELNVYRNVHYLDSLTNERKDKLIQEQDSLIHFLNEIKITKVTIIEKDTKDE